MQQCQSCGMPLEKDLEHGGTEKDGSKSTLFCSLCYKDGEFTWKDATAAKMQELVDGKLKKQNMNWFARKMAIWQIPTLQRWRQQSW